jgi:hypothetical protein
LAAALTSRAAFKGSPRNFAVVQCAEGSQLARAFFTLRRAVVGPAFSEPISSVTNS